MGPLRWNHGKGMKSSREDNPGRPGRSRAVFGPLDGRLTVRVKVAKSNRRQVPDASVSSSGPSKGQEWSMSGARDQLRAEHVVQRHHPGLGFGHGG